MTTQIAPSIGSTTTAKPARLGDTLMTQFGELLIKTLADISVLEVRTFTSEASESSLAATGDPLQANTRLRAFTRIALDGDTQICVPLLANGEPDQVLWKLHGEAVTQARADRATSLATVIATLEKLTGK